MEQAEHDDFESLTGLLPFYVNGTLGRTDRARVDEGLKYDPDLRAELDDQIWLSQTVKQGGEQLLKGRSNTEARLALVLSEMAPQDSVSQPKPPEPKRTIGSALAFLNPAHWHPAVSLALAIAVITQAGWIASHTPSDERDYQTVSGPDGRPLAAGPLLIIRPSETAPWADIEYVLASQGLSIVSGPDEGRLTVRADAPHPDLVAIAARLRASPGIQFVGVLK